MRGYEDKIDEPIVPRTRPSWCADPCLEMVKNLPYLDFVSECFHFFFDYQNPAPSSCQESKDSSSVFRARPRRLDEEPKRADALETFPDWDPSSDVHRYRNMNSGTLSLSPLPPPPTLPHSHVYASVLCTINLFSGSLHLALIITKNKPPKNRQ